MKNFLLTLILTIPLFLNAQINYDFEITVIDSFECFKTAQAGLATVRAVNYNNEIHLAYILQDTSTNVNLMYAIRTDAGFTFDTVATLTNFHNYGPHTSLQFDSLGNPHIYCASMTSTSERTVYAYEKVNNKWQGTFISTTGYIPYLVADPDGSKELGFAFWAPSSLFFSGRIVYAHNNYGTWEFDALSNDLERYRTKPSIINSGGKTFVAYGEGNYPDTLITRVHVKENDNWSLSYEEIINTGYSGGGIDGLFTRLGAANDGIYFMHSLNYIDGHPTYLKNSGSGWQLQNINYDASITGYTRNPYIIYDSDNTAFWLSQGNAAFPKLSWVKSNGDGGVIDLIHRYYAIWLYDMVLKNGDLYIYYFEGAAGYPYNYPVTFKELKVNIQNIFTRINSDLAVNEDYLLKNYPNPFQQSTEISFHLSKDANVVINIFNTDGKYINKFLNKSLSQGDYKFKFDAKELPSGMYFYTLSVNGVTSSNKMLLVK